MTGARLLLLLSAIGALMLCFATADAGAFLLLIAIVALVASAAVINRFHKPKLNFSFNFPTQCEKKEAIDGTVTLENFSLIGYRKVMLSLIIKNRLTGEALTETVEAPLMAKEDASLEFSLKSRFCGEVEISCNEVRLYDFFAITFRRIKINHFSSVTVLPETFPVSITFNWVSGAESIDNYAVDCHGKDLSEVFDFVEYTPGDSIKQIQWKLSEKHNRLIVKRGSLPLEKSVLIVMLLTSVNPEAASATAEVTASVVQSLCEAGVFCKVMIPEKDRFEIYDIEGEEDLAAVLPKLLSVSYSTKTPYNNEPSSKHCICITDDRSTAAAFSQNGALSLLADGEAAEGIIGFSSFNPSEDLFELKI